MKTRLKTILHWALLLAVASHGAVPGLVVCVEASGQVALEAILTQCCDDGSSASTAPATVTAPGTKQDDPCGPCLDSPVSPVPTTKPKGTDSSDLITAPANFTLLDFTKLAIRRLAKDVAGRNTSFIPVATTHLLI